MLSYMWGWFAKICAHILSQGPMPHHIAIILDGNRRYARKHKLATVAEGHKKGCDKIPQVCRMLGDMGVKELTLYIFSIENFKRAKEEVEALMTLAARQLQEILDDIQQLHDTGICIEIVGDWNRIPDHLKPKASQLMVLTKDNNRLKLNLAFVYTGRNEITNGANRVIKELSCGDSYSVNDISENVLESSFRLKDSRPVDILIRTSGESRLSDFLLWQVADDTLLKFVDVSWPEFTFADMFWAILEYQYGVRQLQSLENQISDEEDNCGGASHQDKMMINSIRSKQWETICASLEAKAT